MLRRLSRDKEAEVLEKEIRQYRREHPYGMSPERFKKLVLDNWQGPDYILGTKSGQNLFKGMTDLGGGAFFQDLTGIMVHCSQCNLMTYDRSFFKRCSKCKDALYCSEDCQKKHWSVHKKTCRAAPGQSS